MMMKNKIQVMHRIEKKVTGSDGEDDVNHSVICK